MQSGISASQELRRAFQKLQTSPEQRGLLCTIVNETLQPFSILEPATSSFENDLSTLLEPHILTSKNATLYIVLRRYELSSTAPFVAITYVPDAAPVRSKMLYASTRLTLVRELGIERFRETIFATTPEELTVEGFKKHDQHVLLDAPLTEEEKSLGEVKRKEAEESRGMTERKSHGMTNLTVMASDEVLAALTELKISGVVTTKHVNLIQLKINIETEVLELESKTCTPISELSTNISNTIPRFSFYRYIHTHNDITSSPILFIYTCPSSSRLRERMLYAASSRSVQQLAEEVIGLEITKKIEEGDPADITMEGVLTDLYPETPVLTKTFDRPRRPGRGPSKIR